MASIFANSSRSSAGGGDTSANFSAGAVLLRFILDLVKEQRHQSETIGRDQVIVTNTSAITPDDADQEWSAQHLLMPVWAYQLAAGYLIFISVLGLFMNIVVVLVIINDPQKSPLNWMLLNLACSDGMIAGFGTPISAAAALQYNWPFSDELCVAYAMIMSTAGIGSITTLTALALWRCQLVVYCPAKRSGAFANHHSGGGGGGSAKLGRVQAAVLLTLIWAYALAVTCPPLFGWGRYDREAAHISCSVNWESKMANNRSYILYMFTFGLFVPMVVIICSYVSILRVVRKKMEQKKGNDAAEKRVTVMVACMVGAFLAAWTPYSILALFETFIGVADHYSGGGGPGRNMSNTTTLSLDGRQQFNDNQPTSNEEDDNNFFDYYVGAISPAFATIPSLFAKTSAVLNPLIYGLLNTQFRLAWDKFTTQLLGRHHHQHNHRRHKNKHLRHLLNCPSASPTLKPSASVHLSMKDIVSNESQSAYVMANTVGGQPGINLAISPPIKRYLLQQQRRQPSKSGLFDVPETSFTYQQPIRMKPCKNSLGDQPEEEVIKSVMLLAVGSISGSVTNDNPNEDSAFSQQTSFMEDSGLVLHGDTVPSQSPIRLPATSQQSNQNDRRVIDADGDGEANVVIEADNIIRISYITASVDC
ncbi:pteropsin6 [Daphnia pulex]|uniref:Pteropsin6 n=1 Tax=Daphnia pulex TaxID=6669 RepID=E9GJ16_DAPPU|nr:pteropsin6 [Daphnia pulex]|eukprot:EFX80365.1 pteropsin6 [Daphnia pulex]